MGRWGLGWGLVCAAAIACAAAPGAQASKAELQPNSNSGGCGGGEPAEFTLHYVAAQGEVNKVKLAGGRADTTLISVPGACSRLCLVVCSVGGDVIQDPGAAITAGYGCRSVLKSVVSCDEETGRSEYPSVIDLGDRDDYLAILVHDRPATISAGPGNDTIKTVDDAIETISCGYGTDTVTADKRDYVAADCENVQRLPGLPSY